MKIKFALRRKTVREFIRENIIELVYGPLDLGLVSRGLGLKRIQRDCILRMFLGHGLEDDSKHWILFPESLRQLFLGYQLDSRDWLRVVSLGNEFHGFYCNVITLRNLSDTVMSVPLFSEDDVMAGKRSDSTTNRLSVGANLKVHGVSGFG